MTPELFAGVTYDEWSPFTISLFTTVFFSFSAATFFFLPVSLATGETPNHH